MYSASSYAFAQAVIELPYGFVQAAVYVVIVYSMIGFEWTAAKFFWYIFFTYFTLMYYTYFGMKSVALTPNHKIASVVSIAFHALWNLFSGFTIPGPRIPSYMVEMVLLGMSNGLDHVWIGCFPVWRCKGHA
ncbi:hypothetical protein F2P56_016586 [Juglans regia]|uniref:ABC-2 type transporter transmembrane domain-containing protein n=1 Tax=Juglans regia TaxID=51240 RepID=A0A833XIQ3_JUGRE|nr:hypothetical protein F2P56_016586 [Juglans regia]